MFAMTVTDDPLQLTLMDVCDACGYVADVPAHPSAVSRAYVLVTLPSGRSLTLCGHHYAEHELALAASGAVVTDDRRDLLTVKPESGML